MSACRRATGGWLTTHAPSVALAMNLVPLSGVAFLRFIGVLRDRLGMREDRLLATVFLSSGLLFLSMLFASAAMAGASVLLHAAAPQRFAGSQTFAFGRVIVYEIVNIDALKMAAVFIMVVSTLALRSRFVARWIAWLGPAIALMLIFASRCIEWMLLSFPLWVLLVSLYILWDNLQVHAAAS